MNREPSPSEKAEAIDSTTAYIEGLPTGVETESAVESIGGWIETLTDDGRPELTKIAGELQNLRQLLSGDQLDGKAIGKVMTTLGELTTRAAPLAEQGIADRLTKLGNWLSKAGQSM
jgi:hypothetical protein